MNSSHLYYCLLLSTLFLFEAKGLSQEQSRDDCVYLNRISTGRDERPEVRISSNDLGHQINVTTCQKLSEYCYTLWNEDENGSIKIISQGCWESSSQQDCSHSQCLSSMSRTSKDMGQQQPRFCCCSGHLCNRHVAVDHHQVKNAEMQHSLFPTVPPAVAFEGTNQSTVISIVSVGIIVGAVIVGSLFVLQMCDRRKKESATHQREGHHHPHYGAQAQSLLSAVNFDSLKLINVIGQGRYGTVWKASLDEAVGGHVAVKVFNQSTRSFFNNERDIYSLPFMDHANIAAFVGHQEFHSSAGPVQYRLILEYAPYGSLQDYLRQNSIDWATLCQMGRSVARGMAHLHADVCREGEKRLSVAHRDVSSRNILVKADLTCCLCDLGFAIQMEGAHYFYQGEQQHAETTSLSDVGTLRYMAPEILEGAVNLRECESSLKQIDVYALGLVLWEISHRCWELYPSQEAPPYRLPFEDETGPHVTLEQMKMLVCRHKARPLLPHSWRDKSATVRLLKDTMEDAWDQDAEARLTSLCIEQRWTDLPVMWERERHKGLSPNMRANVTNANNQHQPNQNNSTSVKIEDVVDDVLKKNCTVVWPPSPRALQPHQGHNPCQERNTMTVALEEFSVVGNDLVSRSIHPSQPAHPPSIQETSNRPAEAAVSELPLSSGRIINPIPYVQNAVREVHPTRPRPEPTTAGIGQTLSQFFRFRSPAERVPPEEQEQLAHGNKSVLKSNNQRVPSGFPSLVKVNNIRQQPEVAPSSAIDGCDNTLSVDLAV